LRTLGVEVPVRRAVPRPPSVAGSSRRRRGLLTVVVATGLVSLFTAVLWIALTRPERLADLRGVSIGAGSAVHCLEDGRFTGCDRRPDGLMSGASPHGFVMGKVGPWAPLHYFMAIPLRAVGMSAFSTLSVLIVIDALALLALLTLAWVLAARVVGVLWGPVVAVCIVTSPLLWYTTIAFGEVLVALLAVLAVATILTRRSPQAIAAAVMVAGLTKETNPPFIVVLCALCVLTTMTGRIERRRAFLAIGLGGFAAVALNTLFNVFRFGSVLNSHYAGSVYQLSSPRVIAQFFAALWIAPNTGILWFWPAIVIGLVFLAVVGIRAIPAGAAPAARWSGVLLVVLLVIQMLGLARWYSPFGWIAWGSRLVLPLLPAMLLSGIAALGSAGTSALRRALRSGWIWIVGAAVALAGIPQVAVLWRLRTVASLFIESGVCKNAAVEINQTRYYRCTVNRAWRLPPLLERVVGQLRSPAGIVVTALVTLAVGALVVLARDLAANDDDDAAGTAASAGRR
jgi:hypothetical protein